MLAAPLKWRLPEAERLKMRWTDRKSVLVLLRLQRPSTTASCSTLRVHDNTIRASSTSHVSPESAYLSAGVCKGSKHQLNLAFLSSYTTRNLCLSTIGGLIITIRRNSNFHWALLYHPRGSSSRCTTDLFFFFFYKKRFESKIKPRLREAAFLSRRDIMLDVWKIIAKVCAVNK